MKCVSCGANLPAGVDQCHHCDTLNDTDFRQLGQARVEAPGQLHRGEEQCPRCHSALMALKIQMGESYPVHRCKRCLGTFWGNEELRHLLATVADGRGLDAARLAQLCKETPREIWPIAYLPCPDCRETMLRTSFGDGCAVVGDRCKDHGVWLDGGELGRLLNWARAGGVLKPQGPRVL